MERFDFEYRSALLCVEDSITRIMDSSAILSGECAVDAEKIDSNLDGWDYCYAVAIGIAGVAISTNEAFALYLDQIHKAASGASGEYDRFQTFLGNALHHKGDHIDIMGNRFINRDLQTAYTFAFKLLFALAAFSPTTFADIKNKTEATKIA